MQQTENQWKKPAGVTAGFLAFCLLCGAVDSAVLTPHYTLPAPVTEVKEVYVDPAPQPRAASTVESAKVTTLSSPVVSSVFRSRFESFRITPPAMPDPEEATPSSGSGVTNMPFTPPKTVTVSASAGCFEKMQAWKAQYPDVVGYIKIPGTNIDHPVVWNANNLYYEHLDINKNYSRNGVIWADQDVTPNSKNTILYGHNWTNYSATPRIGNPNDVMFAQLTAYQYPSFAQSHPTIQYANENGDGTYVVFGAFYTTKLGSYTSASLSPTTALSMAQSNNLYSFDTDVKSTDKIITLSTCTRYFGQFEAQRFVVMARKLRDGENASVTISSRK